MRRTLVLLIILSLNYSCKFEEIKDYDKDISISTTSDTLNIKKIKIKTH